MTEQLARMQRHSRRRFLQVAGVTGFAVTASGLGDYAVAQTPVAIDSYSQSPSLEGKDLPSVAKRVGEQPLVLEPNETIGTYGGTIRTGLVGGQDDAWLSRTVGYDNLVSWSVDWTEILPNVAQAFEGSEDGRSYTFHLRPDTKWSDGAPFTSADVAFYVNDVYRNEELTASLGDNPYTIEVQDDITFTITFEQPNGFALTDMAHPDGETWTRYPKHYLEQFHTDFNTENLDELIEQEGAADWVELFRIKGGLIPGTPYDAQWSNPDLPTLKAWRLVEPYGAGTRVTYERNPYYWKVDPDGQQLPYIEGWNFNIVEDAEVLLLRASSGEIDFSARHINNVTNKPVLAENRERGNYEFFDLVPSSMNTNVFAVNLTSKDQAKREIFQNKDFRIGLSHAINRDEINNAVYVSQGEPWQLAPRRESNWYNEDLAKQYVEFDVDKANEHLDKVLPDKDDNGMRLMSNGEPFSFMVETGADNPQRVDASNLVVGYWNDVGIAASFKPEDRALFYTRKNANEHDCGVWGGDGGLRDAILDPRWYFPYSTESLWATAWAIWFSKPENPQAEPEEPPEDIRRQMDIYNEIERTPDPRAQNEMFNEILAIAQQTYNAIGTLLPPPGYGIKKVNLKNVPAQMPQAWTYPSPAPSLPMQYYFEDTGE